jgi:hypothetical protein
MGGIIAEGFSFTTGKIRSSARASADSKRFLRATSLICLTKGTFRFSSGFGRLVSIASASDSDISGDKLKCSAKKSPVNSKLGYRKH